MNNDKRLTLDNESEIFFYEQEFYIFSNFSAFAVVHQGHIFPTSEHLYQWSKFQNSTHPEADAVAFSVLKARSAHDAFKLARKHKDKYVSNWDDIKFTVMENILRLKVDQHEYVKKKLKESTGRVLIENSPRDSIYGWGPDRNGQNMLGKLWMKIRSEMFGDKES